MIHTLSQSLQRLFQRRIIMFISFKSLDKCLLFWCLKKGSISNDFYVVYGEHQVNGKKCTLATRRTKMNLICCREGLKNLKKRPGGNATCFIFTHIIFYCYDIKPLAHKPHLILPACVSSIRNAIVEQ